MGLNKIKTFVKRVWRFIVYDDSWTSFIVDAILIVIIGKFILFPAIGLLLGTPFPMVAVVSDSMDHRGLEFDAWWDLRGRWYEEHNITKDKFAGFYLPNGFKKGDVLVIKGVPISELKVGDIIVYSVASRSDPIIHRVVVANSVINTKGDANFGQINFEKNIQPTQIKGKAVLLIPKIGWVKVGLLEILNLI